MSRMIFVNLPVTDLARWARWLSSASDPEGRGDVDGILSRASRREMQQAHRTVPGRGAHPAAYGFGLFVEQYPDLGPVVSHSGGYPGFVQGRSVYTAASLHPVLTTTLLVAAGATLAAVLANNAQRDSRTLGGRTRTLTGAARRFGTDARKAFAW